MSRREQVLARIAPITEKPGTDRRMRIAVLRASEQGPIASAVCACSRLSTRRSPLWSQSIPVSAEIAEWFRNEKLIPKSKRALAQGRAQSGRDLQSRSRPR